MREFSKQEIMNRVYEERDKNRQPMSKTENVLLGALLIFIISMIVTGISNLFSK